MGGEEFLCSWEGSNERFFIEDVRNSSGGLKLCAGYDAGAETAVHVIHDVFKSNET